MRRRPRGQRTENLSRTDAWAVEGLRSVEEVDEVEEESADAVPLFPVATLTVRAEIADPLNVGSGF